jgi:hypothetical protein
MEPGVRGRQRPDDLQSTDGMSNRSTDDHALDGNPGTRRAADRCVDKAVPSTPLYDAQEETGHRSLHISCRGPRCRVIAAGRECARVRGVRRPDLYLKSNRCSVLCLPKGPPGSPSRPSCPGAGASGSPNLRS